MTRRNYGQRSGVIIDLCRDHGVWLDHSELEKILDFVRQGGLDQARERRVRELEQRAQRARNEARSSSHSHGGSSAASFGGLGSFSEPEGPDLLDVVRWMGGTIGRLFS